MLLYYAALCYCFASLLRSRAAGTTRDGVPGERNWYIHTELNLYAVKFISFFFFVFLHLDAASHVAL